MNEPGKRYEAMSGASRGMALAFEFVGAVMLFWFLGRLVDGWLNIEPWAQVVGSLIGWVGGFLHVYYSTRRPAEKRSDRLDDRAGKRDK